MLRWLRRRPEGRPDGAELPIDWRDIDASEADQHPDLVLRILAQEVDGVTVRGVFTPEEMARAVEAMADHREHETPVVFGSTLGRPLMQSGMSRDRTQHLDDAERYRPAFADMFGGDPHERVADLVRTLTGGLEMKAPSEDGRPYIPGQIRVMEPAGGGLPAHAGNEFLISNMEGSASHLWETTDALDHLSYFVMVQPAEVGGELSVFDKLWVDPREEGDGPVVPLTHDGTEFDRLPALAIVPNPGDLIMFRGGRRWHRVEEVFGSVPRITYGGFAAPSRDRSEIHCWA
jgi:hypothetical protein